MSIWDKIQGIGAGFVPVNFDRDVTNLIVRVKTKSNSPKRNDASFLLELFYPPAIVTLNKRKMNTLLNGIAPHHLHIHLGRTIPQQGIAHHSGSSQMAHPFALVRQMLEHEVAKLTLIVTRKALIIQHQTQITVHIPTKAIAHSLLSGFPQQDIFF